MPHAEDQFAALILVSMEWYLKQLFLLQAVGKSRQAEG